ncbi:DUF4303 domain-containing protein [Paenactinomyces guangxiensis]|uniref:DUF4303 domain-containing protein n=1 Tax=Paenactinomyces guangxiensis TaxID=1490290 RepID=A0A7W1WSX2_9BACL|nr:DUF4303 domain-containing protein [Paenactinomyces guangxiensis]MBA4495388.1 DUF4303 domain-containing protein [Paenactinomyces guangxiensis]MBH8592491.1 DUF4303 domain-containing protein [Paenactinomyces guangxiensis]
MLFKKKLLNKKDFNALEAILFEDCVKVLREFSNTDDNKNVYAFVLGDPDHGSLSNRLYTLDSFQRRVKQSYSDYPEEELYGIAGLKYSVGDFCFMYTPDQSSKQLNAIFDNIMM